jgi:hypothetical protein
MFNKAGTVYNQHLHMPNLNSKENPTPGAPDINYDLRSGVSLNFCTPQETESPYGHFTVPVLRKGTLDDVKFNRKSMTVTGNPGLKEYIRIDSGTCPLYVFDSHNFALYAWAESSLEGAIHPGATLLHFDDHADAQIARRHLIDLSVLPEIAVYSKELNINQFIEPAVFSGLFTRTEYIAANFEADRDRFTASTPDRSIPLHQTGMNGKIIRQFSEKEIDPKSLVVDIDIDYFSADAWKQNPAMWGYKTKAQRYADSIRKMKILIAKAGVVTIATSPSHFADQKQAIKIVRELLS